jgi:hypothetical protein
MLCLSYYLLCFSFNKIGEEGEQVLPRGEGMKGKGGGGMRRMGRGGPMYTHMNKCINN